MEEKKTNIFGEMKRKGYEEIASEISPDTRLEEDGGSYKLTLPYRGREKDLSIKYSDGNLDIRRIIDPIPAEYCNEFYFTPMKLNVGIIDTDSLYYHIDDKNLVVKYSKIDDKK